MYLELFRELSVGLIAGYDSALQKLKSDPWLRCSYSRAAYCHYLYTV